MENPLQLINFWWLMSSIGIKRFMERIAKEEDWMERREWRRGELKKLTIILAKSQGIDSRQPQCFFSSCFLTISHVFWKNIPPMPYLRNTVHSVLERGSQRHKPFVWKTNPDRFLTFPLCVSLNWLQENAMLTKDRRSCTDDVTTIFMTISDLDLWCR